MSTNLTTYLTIRLDVSRYYQRANELVASLPKDWPQDHHYRTDVAVHLAQGLALEPLSVWLAEQHDAEEEERYYANSTRTRDPVYTLGRPRVTDDFRCLVIAAFERPADALAFKLRFNDEYEFVEGGAR